MVTLCATRNGSLVLLRRWATSWLSRALGAACGKEAGIDGNQSLKWPIIVHQPKLPILEREICRPIFHHVGHFTPIKSQE